MEMPMYFKQEAMKRWGARKSAALKSSPHILWNRKILFISAGSVTAFLFIRMINFNEAKSILESVANLVKKAATIDLQEKIINLREYIISLKDENITLKEESQTVKLQLEASQNFTLKNGLYWKNNDSVPFCQKCLDGSRKRIRLQIWADGWKCFECDKYYAPAHQAGRVQVFRPGIDKRNIAR